jgi:hypothetical protein
VGRLNEFRADAGRERVPFEVLISVGKRDHNPDTLEGKLTAMDVFAEASTSAKHRLLRPFFNYY